jgi:hypothetical protein
MAPRLNGQLCEMGLLYVPFFHFTLFVNAYFLGGKRGGAVSGIGSHAVGIGRVTQFVCESMHTHNRLFLTLHILRLLNPPPPQKKTHTHIHIHRLFLTLFLTGTEGRNLFSLYLRNGDPAGLGRCAMH